MKYGVLFLTLSFFLFLMAFVFRGWFLLLLWPATSLCLVGLGYVVFGHRVFGKCSDGSMRFTRMMILLPYLGSLWLLWHVIRLVSREPAYNTLVDGIVIGRRLLSKELPFDINTVVDLTSEFPAPLALRSVRNYVAAPMLDGFVLAPHLLAELVSNIVSTDSPVFIHCAQGHGRTGLVAALVLVARGDASHAENALDMVKSCRPLVRLNTVQKRTLHQAASLIQSRGI